MNSETLSICKDVTVTTPRIARLLMSLTMEGETVVLRRDTRLRPQKVADHPITPRDAHCLI